MLQAAICSSSCAGVLAVALLATPASAQQYSVARIEPAPGAYTTMARGMNDQGHVVGYCMFLDGGPTLRAWIWKPGQGLEFLPQPPGQTTWIANDVNESGVICGDGGYDFGQAWRYEDGVYELLGFLPTGDMSTAHAIDELGRVACTSRDSQHFTTPPIAFLSVPGQPPQPVAAGGHAASLNDAGQIVGYTNANKAYRATTSGGVQLLGNLGTKPLTWAWSINAHGHVVGDAAQANGNSHRPFLFTDEGGMQEIGDFATGSVAVSINDHGVVVGDSNVPWRWSAREGVVLLGQAIDPAEQLNLLDAIRINNAGQILARAIDPMTSERFPVVLTPIDAPKPFADVGAGLAGSLGVPELDATLVEGPTTTAELRLEHAAPHAPLLLAFGTARADVPLFGGVLVPDVFAGGGVLAFATDASGAFAIDAPWPADWPAGVQLFLQAWLVDGGAAQGASASNALASPAL